MDKIIKTKDFTLRPFRKGDVKSLQKNINHKEIYRYTLRIPYPYTINDAKGWIALNLKLSKKKKKEEINFAIDINNEVAGGIGLRDIKAHKAEIGYWLGKKYWNKGIMTKAVRLITDYAFKELRLCRVYAAIAPQNKASARVLIKSGYEIEGLLRKNEIKDGEICDSVMYAKIKG